MPEATSLTRGLRASLGFKRRIYLQLSLDRYFTSPQKQCFINILPLELLVEILVLVSYDTNHTEQRHCDPFTLPDKHWSLRREDNGLQAKRTPACISDLYFYNGCMIFCHAMPWNWLEVTRVCKAWYCAAHSSAEFWSRIPLQTSDALSRSIKLAGTFPLRLHGEFDSSWRVQKRLHDCFQQLDRIGDISLSWKIICDLEWLQVEERLRAPAPELGRLCLRSVIHFCTMYGHGLFGGMPPPKLQDVKLDGFRLPRIDLCLNILAPTLTSLVISECTLETNWSVLASREQELITGLVSSNRTFFDALAMMPLLETLFITGTLMPVDIEQDHFNPPKTMLSMPHLRQFKLHGTLRAISRIITNLVIPNTTSLTLWFYHHGLGVDTDTFVNLPRLLAVFRKHFIAAAEDGAYYSRTYMEFDIGEGEDEALYAQYAFTNPCNAATHELPTRVELRHHWNWEDEPTADICSLAASLCECIPHDGPDVSSEVMQVCPIDESHGVLAKDWFQSAVAISGLTHLRLRHYAGFEFLAWLADREPPSQQQGGDIPGRSAHYPPLHSLELIDECYVTRDTTTLEHVLVLLEHHSFTVKVKGCHVDLAAYARLRDILGDMLQWEWKDNWMADAKSDTMDCFPRLTMR